jgi:hypothetical protein
MLTAQQSPVSGTDIVQNLTNDHNKAASSRGLPFGDPGVNGSPYFSVSDLIKQGVKLRTEVSNAQLVAADGVYVPASE